MHSDLLHPSKYLRAADLRGKDVTLTIASVAIEELTMVGGAKERKPVVQFEEMLARPEADRKAWVINKTNKRSIVARYGTETDDWIGQPLTLYPTTTKFGRDTVDCIRVREG